MNPVDPSLYEVSPMFETMGGPRRVRLSEKGKKLAYCVGAGLTKLEAAYLRTLILAGGEDSLTYQDGQYLRRTEVGKACREEPVWFSLMDRGLVSRVEGGGVKATTEGLRIDSEGRAECCRLLTRVVGATGIPAHQDSGVLRF